MTAGAGAYFQDWPKWPGETVVVLAGGPSLTPGLFALVERAHAEGRCRAIAVNRSYALAPWADILFGHDWAGFWCRHFEAQEIDGIRFPPVLEFAGLKLRGQARKNNEKPDEKPIGDLIEQHVRRVRKDSKPEAWLQGAIWHRFDSGFDAIQEAAICIGPHTGGRILLAGFDAKPNGHWHAGYGKSPLDYSKIIPLHRGLGQLLRKYGIPTFNCSEESAIPVDAYPQTRLQDVL